MKRKLLKFYYLGFVLLCSCVSKELKSVVAEKTAPVIIAATDSMPMMRDSVKSVYMSSSVYPLLLGETQDNNMAGCVAYDYIDGAEYVQLDAVTEADKIGAIFSDSTFIFVALSKQDLYASEHHCCPIGSDAKDYHYCSFSSDGKLIGKFGELGKDYKGSYDYLPRMSVDKLHKEICIYDYPNRLLFYDYATNFLREEPVTFDFSQIFFADGKRYYKITSLPGLDADTNPYIPRIMVGESDKLPALAGFPMPNRWRGNNNSGQNISAPRCFDSNIFVEGDDVYFTHALSDTVWQITESGANACYVIEYPVEVDRLKDFQLNEINDSVFDLRYKALYSLGGVLMSGELALFEILTPSEYDADAWEVSNILYNRTSGNSVVWRRSSFLYDSEAMDRVPLWSVVFSNKIEFALDDNTFAFIVSPEKFKRDVYAEKKFYELFSADEKRFAKDVKLAGGKVLCILKFRNDF